MIKTISANYSELLVCMQEPESECVVAAHSGCVSDQERPVWHILHDVCNFFSVVCEEKSCEGESCEGESCEGGTCTCVRGSRVSGSCVRGSRV